VSFFNPISNVRDGRPHGCESNYIVGFWLLHMWWCMCVNGEHIVLISFDLSSLNANVGGSASHSIG
jgi:hypothetical protein